jgi:hypothetical protein
MLPPTLTRAVTGNMPPLPTQTKATMRAKLEKQGYVIFVDNERNDCGLTLK